jgi:hypothetical protein
VFIELRHDIVRLQPRLDRVERILAQLAFTLPLVLLNDPLRTATNVESRLLELAATSVLYFLVHLFACSLRNTARDTSVRSFGLLGIFFMLGLSSSCCGILAFASCGRLQCLPTAIAMRPVAGQAPSRPRARHDSGAGGRRAQQASKRVGWC